MSEQIVRRSTKYRTKKFKFNKGLLALALVTALVIGCLTVPGLYSKAVFDKSKCRTYQEYTSDTNMPPIEDASVFIGTYIIHINALTDKLYQDAVESATDSSQQTRFYKSELAEGGWRNLSDTTGLPDLGPDSGVAVDETTLNPLYISYVVSADGTMRDAWGNVVNAFDNPDPYDLWSLTELRSLRTEMAGDEQAPRPSEAEYLTRVKSVERDTVANDKFIYRCLSELFDYKVKNEFTDLCDSQLADIVSMKTRFTNENKKDLADTVDQLGTKIDAARRAEVFKILSEKGGAIDQLEEKVGGTYATDDGPKSANPGMSFTAAITSSRDACNTSYGNQSSKSLQEGTTLFSKYEYEYALSVLDKKEEADVITLCDLYCIESGEIKDAQRELATVQDPLLPEVETQWRAGAEAGASSKYQNTKNSQGVMAAQSLLTEQMSTLEGYRAELEDIITAHKDRQSLSDALDFVLARMEWTNEIYSNVVNDAFKEMANESIDLHMAFLRQVAEDIVSQDPSLAGKLKALLEKLAELNSQKQKALDNNDLKNARMIDAEIDALNKQIEEEKGKLNNIINSDNASLRDKEMAKLALGNGEDKLKQQLLDKGLQNLADGNNNIVKNVMGALGAIGGTEELKTLKKRIADKNKDANGKNTGELSGLLSDAKQAIKDSKQTDNTEDNLKDGINDMFGDSSDASDSSGEGSNGAFGLGDDLDGLSSADMGAAIAGLSMLGNDGNKTAAALANKFATMYMNKLEYLYRQYTKDKKPEYVSLETIGFVTDFRYVYYDDPDITSMSGNGVSYSFKNNSDEATDTKKEKISLTKSTVRLSGIIYVAEADTSSLFECESEPVPNSNIAVCMTPTVKEKALEFYNTYK
ncbi:MAG: hypothetical protein K6F00_11580 [Lachnospiraceae bacterium]|nr:hypothetical protein [Lachnospiraceae bacterium]